MTTALGKPSLGLLLIATRSPTSCAACPNKCGVASWVSSQASVDRASSRGVRYFPGLGDYQVLQGAGGAKDSNDRSVGRLLGRSVAKSFGRSTGRSAGRPAGRAVGRSVSRSVGRSVGQSVGWLIDRLFTIRGRRSPPVGIHLLVEHRPRRRAREGSVCD